MNKKKPQQAKPEPVPMSLDDMTRVLAAGLREAIQDVPLSYLKAEPEEAFIDLACRLIFGLRTTLTIVPVPPVDDRVRVACAEAAARTFAIFTRWLREHPECSYQTKISASGKFQIVVKTPKATQLFFGETVQDACAQAAQTIEFNGGDL